MLYVLYSINKEHAPDLLDKGCYTPFLMKNMPDEAANFLKKTTSFHPAF
jgi:hypothetical protein